jgi:hypothetical protein
MRSGLSALLSLLVVSFVAAPQAYGQGFSNWSTPVNITQLNTSGFEG